MSDESVGKSTLSAIAEREQLDDYLNWLEKEHEQATALLREVAACWPQNGAEFGYVSLSTITKAKEWLRE